MIKDRLTFFMFLFMGIGLFISSIALSYRSLNVLFTYEVTSGKLIDFAEKLKKDNKTGLSTQYFSPIYQFYDRKGNLHTINSGEYSNSKSFSSTRAKIYYNKEFPEISVTGIFQLYIVPLISIFFCIVCLGMAYVFRKPAVPFR